MSRMSQISFLRYWQTNRSNSVVIYCFQYWLLLITQTFDSYEQNVAFFKSSEGGVKNLKIENLWHETHFPSLIMSHTQIPENPPLYLDEGYDSLRASRAHFNVGSQLYGVHLLFIINTPVYWSWSVCTVENLKLYCEGDGCATSSVENIKERNSWLIKCVREISTKRRPENSYDVSLYNPHAVSLTML